MKVVFCLAAMLIAGCAAQPASAPAPAAAQPASAVQPASAAPASSAAAPPAPASAETHRVKVDASNVVAVQHAGYKLVNKDGQPLFCRTDTITGSRLRTQTTCLTERELADQMNATKQGMDRINQAAPPPPGH